MKNTTINSNKDSFTIIPFMNLDWENLPYIDYVHISVKKFDEALTSLTNIELVQTHIIMRMDLADEKLAAKISNKKIDCIKKHLESRNLVYDIIQLEPFGNCLMY